MLGFPLGRILLTLGFFMALWPLGWPEAAPIVIVKDRDLSFGRCDNTPGATYVVAAAELPGGAACTGAFSARFSVTGDPGAKVRITSDNTIGITNGVDSINVKSDQSPSGGNISLSAAGTLTIYMGGDGKIPPAGIPGPTTLSGSSILTVIYK
ncbi:MAG: DUF4402 domain-containing protein [bacterium]